MKLEFESVLFGLAFLVLALISMPQKPEAAASEPDAPGQSTAAPPASGQ